MTSPAEPYEDFARRLEYAALTSETDETVVKRLCAEAREFRMGAVVVNPTWVRLAAELTAGTAIRVVSTVGFPLGANRTDIKVAEAVEAVEDGAQELDMVANIGLLCSGRFDDVAAEIRKVRRNITDAVRLKVIIEAAKLPEAYFPSAVEAVVSGGAQFVKTGTGFFGGATPEMVRLLCTAANGRVEIKASGGIRTLEHCRQLIEVGASRLGSSSFPAILNEYRRTFA